MEEADYERLRQQFDEKVREHLPDAPIDRIELLKHGDAPEVEPGQFIVRVVVAVPDGADDDQRLQAFEAFHDQNRERFHELRRKLDELPGQVFVQFTAGDEPGTRKNRVIQLGGRPAGLPDIGPGLTPVMARVGPEDIETLDMLIAAGIASSRAEAVRWALARIRERPAYEQLRARTREIEELKSQF